MTRNPKFVIGALVLVGKPQKLSALGTLLALSIVALGASTALAVNTITVTPSADGRSAQVVANLDPAAGRFVELRAISTTPNFGVFTSGSVSPTSEPVSGTNSTSLTFTESTTNVARTMTASFTCNATASVTFQLFVAGATTPAATNTFSCQTLGGGDGGGGANFAARGSVLVTLRASPSFVPCGGGSTTITALDLAFDGSLTPDTGVSFTTSVGALRQTSANTAVLTLGPGHLSATVTASFLATPDATSESKSTLTVQQSCPAGQAGGARLWDALVVTADPNVVNCNGTSTITASARDKNGQLVRGVGFHFAVDNGHLVVSPNNANNTFGIATLTILPDMPSATVKVSAGAEPLGTVEQQITVQNYCKETARTPGNIILKASADPVCGPTFIAANLRDVSGNAPPEAFPVKFVASSGKLDPEEASTFGGTLNVKFTPDAGVAGTVRITAASGAAFGWLDVQVGSPLCAGFAGAGAGGALAVRPPSTGEGVSGSAGGGITIRPPSTGDAGLAAP